jgi:DNA-binding response OmpR family regulator
MTVADLDIDQAARKVHLGGTEIELRPKEFDLLGDWPRTPVPRSPARR